MFGLKRALNPIYKRHKSNPSFVGFSPFASGRSLGLRFGRLEHGFYFGREVVAEPAESGGSASLATEVPQVPIGPQHDPWDCHICRSIDPRGTTPSDRHIWHTWSVWDRLSHTQTRLTSLP